jgi:hypothetical protein
MDKQQPKSGGSAGLVDAVHILCETAESLKLRLMFTEKALVASQSMLSAVSARCDTLESVIEERRGVGPAAERSKAANADFVRMSKGVTSSLESLIGTVLEKPPEIIVINHCIPKLKILARDSILPCEKSTASVVTLFAVLDQFQDTIEGGDYLRSAFRTMVKACLKFAEDNLARWRAHISPAIMVVRTIKFEAHCNREMYQFLTLLRTMLKKVNAYKTLFTKEKKRLRQDLALIPCTRGGGRGQVS